MNIYFIGIPKQKHSKKNYGDIAVDLTHFSCPGGQVSAT
jgi:hypothetical protein